MKKALLLVLSCLTLSLYAKDYITIYNNDFALVKSQIELKLEKGVQNYIYDDIPSGIESNSLIFKSMDNKLSLFTQNYEYDLANTEAILQKFINSEIILLTNDNLEYKGILKFYDFNNIGILDPSSNRLKVIKTTQLKTIDLSSLPDNFFVKPSLKWQIKAPGNDKYPVELSYITGGLSWYVTYNAVYDENKQTLSITPWVTLSNNSGKAFNNINLKLLAGDVNKIRNEILTPRIKLSKGALYNEVNDEASPVFTEAAFSNYHIYKLDQLVDISDKQEKQILLFDKKTVKAKKYYTYNSFASDVYSILECKNYESEGLGLPLPKGVVKIYQENSLDGNLEFIGEDDISHKSKDDTITLKTGKAFDIKAETITNKSNKIGNEYENEIEIKLSNNMKEEIEIIIYHSLNRGDWTILSKNFDYEKKDAYNIVIKQKLKANSKSSLKWVQRIKY
jgi:hypothetical protein